MTITHLRNTRQSQKTPSSRNHPNKPNSSPYRPRPPPSSESWPEFWPAAEAAPSGKRNSRNQKTPPRLSRRHLVGERTRTQTDRTSSETPARRPRRKPPWCSGAAQLKAEAATAAAMVEVRDFSKMLRSKLEIGACMLVQKHTLLLFLSLCLL